MKVGIMPLFGGDTAQPEYVARIARGLEERGFHSVWAVDHILLPTQFDSKYPYSADGSFPVDPAVQGLEPFNLLSFIAAHTSRIRLGTGVVVVPQRNPSLTAKQVADLDVLSGGRFDFGVGVGWLAEEFAALGEPWDKRGSRTDDYLRLMQALWTEHESSYAGRFRSLPPCTQYPKPVQQPHPPLYFGGESEPALRRVARFGHWYGLDMLPEEMPDKIAELKVHCDREGRDVADVRIAVCPYAKPCDRDSLKRYEDAGVDQVIMAAFVPGQDAMEAAIDGIASSLL
ncbi:MAG: LLM class F420-dependent oxidoreductase [Gammaproteobacteria bacterium]|nr:LLM class F420-dependent oxidoreductase [Gammaproteobacteria bacterium]MCP5198737.1 LLM class F420-dependent oxidoreductase [Gammaproteobacteria bacterium]